VRCAVVCPQHLSESWVPLGEVGKLILEPLLGRVGENGIVFVDAP
jgi:hypothetical protein